MLRPFFVAALTSATLLFAGTALPGAAWAQESGDAATTAPTEGEAAAPTTAEEAAATDETASADQSVTVEEMAQGSPDAPVTIIEYGSFTCPHCASWHAESYPRLKADYIDTGKVQFIFREIYFDRPGLWASIVARCGGEMRFFGIHDLIYENQAEWAGVQDPAAIAQNLRRLGISAGLDGAALDACLSDQANAEALVAWFQENAEADQIEGTPTFIINGEKHSNMSWSDMQAIIDAELAEAGQQ